MAESQEKTEAKPAAPADRGSSNRILYALVGVNSLMLVGVMAVVLLRGFPSPPKPPAASAGEPAEAKAEARAEGDAKGEHGKPAADRASLPGPSVRLPDFVVHLRDPEVDRYARLTIEIEVADERAKEQLSARMAQVRDAFISYLADRTTADMRGSEAIAHVKSDLTERLRTTVAGLSFRAVYLTELVVQ